MLDVGIELIDRHQVRTNQQDLKHIGRNGGGPGLVGNQYLTDALPFQHCFGDVVQHPHVGWFKGRCFGVGNPVQRHIGFEVVNPYRLEATIRTQGVDVGKGLFILHPDTGLQTLGNRAAHGLDPPLLRLLFGRRHNELAQQESGDHQPEPDAHQRRQELCAGHAGDTEYVDLGMTRQIRQRIQRPDEYTDRHQLIDPARLDQRDINDGLIQLVTALAQFAELTHQIKEGEEHHESTQNQRRSEQDFATDILAIDHAAPPALRASRRRRRARPVVAVMR